MYREAQQQADTHVQLNVALTEAMSQLQETLRTRDDFLAAASHDLKNPLTSIKGTAQLLQRRVDRTDEVDPEWIALDLLAQAEHGADSALAVISPDVLTLDMVVEAIGRLGRDRPSVADAVVAVIEVPDVAESVALADAIAPEHLELVGEGAEDSVERVTRAGCVFIGGREIRKRLVVGRAGIGTRHEVEEVALILRVVPMLAA